MKIDNWSKLSGITYKGYCIVNPIHNAHKTYYEADILDLNNTPRGKRWKMELIMEGGVNWIHLPSDTALFRIIGINVSNNVTQKYLTKHELHKISTFRRIWEELVEEIEMMEESVTSNVVKTNLKKYMKML